MGQDKLLESAGYHRDDYRWAWGEKANAASKLLDFSVQSGLCVKHTEPKRGKRNNVTFLKPTEAVMAQYESIIDDIAVGRLTSYPMIEQPLEWKLRRILMISSPWS